MNIEDKNRISIETILDRRQTGRFESETVKKRKKIVAKMAREDERARGLELPPAEQTRSQESGATPR